MSCCELCCVSRLYALHKTLRPAVEPASHLLWLVSACPLLSSLHFSLGCLVHPEATPPAYFPPMERLRLKSPHFCVPRHSSLQWDACGLIDSTLGTPAAYFPPLLSEGASKPRGLCLLPTKGKAQVCSSS